MHGIYSSNFNLATGHADLLEVGQCLLGCHLYDDNNNFVPMIILIFGY